MEKEIGNKLIAEFMGAEIEYKTFGEHHPCARYKTPMPFPHLDYDSHGDAFISNEFLYGAIDALEFDTSWDWLMQVVEKIEGLDDGGYFVEIFGRRCDIKPSRGGDIITMHHASNSNSKIHATWLSVIQFIKWYNSKRVN